MSYVEEVCGSISCYASSMDGIAIVTPNSYHIETVNWNIVLCKLCRKSSEFVGMMFLLHLKYLASAWCNAVYNITYVFLFTFAGLDSSRRPFRKSSWERLGTSQNTYRWTSHRLWKLCTPIGWFPYVARCYFCEWITHAASSKEASATIPLSTHHFSNCF